MLCVRFGAPSRGPQLSSIRWLANHEGDSLSYEVLRSASGNSWLAVHRQDPVAARSGYSESGRADSRGESFVLVAASVRCGAGARPQFAHCHHCSSSGSPKSAGQARPVPSLRLRPARRLGTRLPRVRLAARASLVECHRETPPVHARVVPAARYGVHRMTDWPVYGVLCARGTGGLASTVQCAKGSP